jgi:hypothetical protein
MSKWQVFDERMAIPRDPPGSCTLTIRAGGAQLAFGNWQAVAGKTHVVYHIDVQNKRIGIEFINEFDVEPSELAGRAYAIQRNGRKSFLVGCTKLLQSLPFPLVCMERPGRNGLEYGKWNLRFTPEDGMIVINSEARDDE